MSVWRPVHGTITRLDPDLTSEADIQALLSAERVLGRGAADAENPLEFKIELAIGGRKRRVATLDENGEIFKGRSLENFLDYMHSTLRKVEITMDGRALHGPLDIGAVGIEDADLAFVSRMGDAEAEPAETVAESELATVTAEAMGGDAVTPSPSAVTNHDDDSPGVPSSCAFALSLIATSEVPVLATQQNEALGALKFGDLRLLVAQKNTELSARAIPSKEYSLIFSIDEANRSPELLVVRDGQKTTWDWSGELPEFQWITDDASAMRATKATPTPADVLPVPRSFVQSELGAGGVARAAVADIVDATFVDVRRALLAPAHDAARALVVALGLPQELIAFMHGEAGIDTVPGIRVFEPRDTPDMVTEALAWEVAGEGRVNSGLADVYRSVYLERPWLTSLIAAAQASVGGALLARGAMKGTVEKRSGWKMAAGALLVANALSRIATTQYVNSAVQRFVGNVEHPVRD